MKAHCRGLGVFKTEILKGLGSIETVRKLVSGSVKGLLSNIVRSPELAELIDLVVLQSVDFATLAGLTFTCQSGEVTTLNFKLSKLDVWIVWSSQAHRPLLCEGHLALF